MFFPGSPWPFWLKLLLNGEGLVFEIFPHPPDPSRFCEGASPRVVGTVFGAVPGVTSYQGVSRCAASASAFLLDTGVTSVYLVAVPPPGVRLFRVGVGGRRGRTVVR